MARSERVEFVGSSGQTIAGRLERPAGPIRGCALFAHCFTCSKDLKPVVRISRALAARGIAVLRFDFTGLGESGGEFSATDFGSNIDDLEAAADFMRRELGEVRLLIGHSLGGAAVLAAGSRIPEARAVVTLAAPSDTRGLGAGLTAATPGPAGGPTVEIELGGRSITVGMGLVEDLEQHDLERDIAALDRPLLVLHSPVDATVGIEHAARIYRAARHPKSFVALDGADHLLLEREEDALFAAEVIATWAARYLDGPRSAAREVADPAEGQVVVRAGATGFAQQIATSRHRWAADEPADQGGDDLGPSPYELLLAALGACKSMTLRMYAERKGWPLSEIEVRLAHSRTHAEDCAACEAEKGLISYIDVDLSLGGELDDGQRRRLLEIADRCPVHRTLATQTHVETHRVE